MKKNIMIVLLSLALIAMIIYSDQLRNDLMKPPIPYQTVTSLNPGEYYDTAKTNIIIDNQNKIVNPVAELDNTFVRYELPKGTYKVYSEKQDPSYCIIDLTIIEQK